VVAGPDGKRLWHGVLQDITAEKAAEEQLREAEERYRQLVEGIPAITYLDEFDPNDPDLWPTVYISAGRDDPRLHAGGVAGQPLDLEGDDPPGRRERVAEAEHDTT